MKLLKIIFLDYINSLLSKYPKKHIVVEYRNMLAFNGFKIHNMVSEEYATRVTEASKSIIDHILSTNNINICDPVKVEDISLSDHRLLTFSLIENIRIYKPKELYEMKSIM